MVTDVRIDFPGLIKQPLPSGATLWRVRVAGNPNKRITLTVTPDHPDFAEHYRAARVGIRMDAPIAAVDRTIPKSVDWLTRLFEDAMEKKVKAGLMHPGTLRQRAQFYARLRADYGAKEMEIPPSRIIAIRDSLAETPGAADNMVKAIRAMFDWAMKAGIVQTNPAKGVARINLGTGAVPWTVEDLRQYRDHHPRGTMAHLALSLFMFTACRREDVYQLGPRNIKRIGGIERLIWQPTKKGSSLVDIPVLPPLAKAIAAQTVVNPAAFLLTEHGKPFASGDAFGNKFRAWCVAANLADRSPHGIRKAAGNILAEEGATEFQIMAVHGHSSPESSKVYTKGARRARLANDAMQLFAGMDW
jgi:integrase